MDTVIPKEVDKLPFCIQQIIKNKNVSVTDTDRQAIISIAYRYMKATNMKASMFSEIITCLNKSFTNPLSPEEIRAVINNILSSGQIVKPTCDEIKSTPSLNHICQNYGATCPLNRQSRIEILKEAIKNTVSNIIPQTKSVKMLKGTPTYYIVEFQDGNKFQIQDELLLKGSQTFRVWYANTYRKVLMISKDEWLEIVQSWLEMAEETAQEEVSEDDVIKELILNKLRNAVHVSSFEEALKREGRIYVENGKAYIYNLHLIKMIEREGIPTKISFQKLRLILFSYISEQTKVVKIGDNTYRFWVFSVQKVGIPIREIISDIDDDNEASSDEKQEDNKASGETTDDTSEDTDADTIQDDGMSQEHENEYDEEEQHDEDERGEDSDEKYEE